MKEGLLDRLRGVTSNRHEGTCVISLRKLTRALFFLLNCHNTIWVAVCVPSDGDVGRTSELSQTNMDYGTKPVQRDVGHGIGYVSI